MYVLMLKFEYPQVADAAEARESSLQNCRNSGIIVNMHRLNVRRCHCLELEQSGADTDRRVRSVRQRRFKPN